MAGRTLVALFRSSVADEASASRLGRAQGPAARRIQRISHALLLFLPLIGLWSFERLACMRDALNN